MISMWFRAVPGVDDRSLVKCFPVRGVRSALKKFLLLVANLSGGADFDAADRQIQQFVCGVIVGKLPAGLGHFAQLVVHRFDRVCRVDDFAYRRWHVEKRHDLVPCPSPGVDHGGAAFADVAAGESLGGLFGGLDGRRGLDRLRACGDGFGVFAGGVAHRVTDQMHHAGLHDNFRSD